MAVFKYCTRKGARSPPSNSPSTAQLSTTGESLRVGLVRVPVTQKIFHKCARKRSKRTQSRVRAIVLPVDPLSRVHGLVEWGGAHSLPLSFKVACVFFVLLTNEVHKKQMPS